MYTRNVDRHYGTGAPMAEGDAARMDNCMPWPAGLLASWDGRMGREKGRAKAKGRPRCSSGRS